ncbi:U-box domain-containing protein 33 isoform X2 [Eucalyptus grandis]|uniref:U-box domain-containing protein 33 isoform X2 n=1 Tax=Eucalyptus grandis TaxID=71139 RepID=UPI00192EBDF3|nr:U-box domain-containing protein 33 isoform X2 [Eucalyptus grandis]XP_039164967.1 U-box domain-containing protein 33 isoform X2 [Eucalyptus grandis]XP_039164970.1 U-box domain-containing protein 33 isoform X2 [Eucalyptus grandis]
MAMIDGIRLPEFGVPAFMPSTCEVASEPAKPMSEDKIYVAVGKDVKESKSKLVWTVRQSKGNFKICIIHVLVPSRRIPMGGLGAGIPASSANERALREHRENERKNMHELLENYLLVCRQMGVRAEKEYIESDSVERGILELIHLRGIRWLVMGFRADKRYFKFQIGRRMTEIKSRKAIFVRDKAPISCQIWFIFDGQLIHTREAQTVQAVVEVPTHVPLPTTLSPGAEQCAVMPPPPSSIDSFPVHSDAASMPERPDTFQKLGRVSTSPSHRLRSFYYTSLSSNFLDMNENDAREVLEEE